MTKEDIIRKLTSRKFWLAIALFISGLLAFFGKNAEEIDQISGLIMQGAAVVAYILGEGLVDADNKTCGTITLDASNLEYKSEKESGDAE